MTDPTKVTSFVAVYPENTRGRDFVVGDLHGCLKEFNDLKRQVGFRPSRDRMFSVGDLCDRGPYSFPCLELLYEPWFHAVIGNHEQLMLDAYRGRTDGYLWAANGGVWAMGLDADQRALLRDIADKIEALPLAIVVGEGADRFNIVHAEFTGTDAELDAGNYDQRRQMMMVWGRTIAHEDSPFTGEGLSPTYCGHTIMQNVARTASHIFIDTGAFITHGDYDGEGRLTMIEPRTGKEWCSTKPKRASETRKRA